MPYTIDHGSNSRRQAVADWLFGLDLVSPALREKIVTAWVTTWSSSPYAELAEMPYSPGAPHYRLEWHVNDVTRNGLDLARRAAADWGKPLDMDVLVPILILHDVDKPLMYVRESADKVVYSQLYHELQHGVAGAMLLRELGFDHIVVSSVATLHLRECTIQNARPGVFEDGIAVLDPGADGLPPLPDVPPPEAQEIPAHWAPRPSAEAPV